ncbi:MAG: PIN domain-containing protein [Candidatus Azobacteroides sp.]|nr:PIN domain-containing protein [Candidatus Azobacteroides sp.]
MRILLDTDVILDFFFDRKPYSEYAAKILSLGEANRIEIYITPIIIGNVYYLLRKTAPHIQVITQLRLLMSIINVLTVSKETILQAMNSSFKDFEDALQNYSAESDKTIKVIVTRNVKDYKGSTLSVQTPDTFLKTIDYV